MNDIELIAQLNDINGESPIWDPREAAVYWCDTDKTFVHRYDPATGRVDSFKIDRLVRAVGRAGKDQWILVTPDALVLWKKGDATTRVLAEPERGNTDLVLNDGAVDPQGRYVVSTFNAKDLDAPDGNVWSIDGGGKITRLDTGLRLPNGIAFSRDGRTLYVTEMRGNRILAYAYDPHTGHAGNRRVFAEVPKEAGRPDGLVIDCEGYLWSAHWLGWRITRYSPTGTVDYVLELPFATATSMTFGGPNLNDLYISTATKRLSAEDLQQSNNPGGLFRIATRYVGVVEPEFASYQWKA